GHFRRIDDGHGITPQKLQTRPLQLLAQTQFRLWMGAGCWSARLLVSYERAEEGGPRLRGVGTSAGVTAHGTTAPAAQEEGSKWATSTVLPVGFATCENAMHSSQVFSR